ncbi:MAG: hypothetical protein GEV03_15430 [Streptosporangiales bacterium]|nr:hypothetical protein [Streptosporangiales bacterium]
MTDAPGDAKARRLRVAGRRKPYAMLRRAYAARSRGDVGEAERWYRRAAETGDVRAMAGLGEFLLSVSPDRPAEAESWLRRAAEADDISALFRLGELAARNGDWEEAVRAHEQAGSLILRARRDPSVEYELSAATVIAAVIAAAVVPFVQALMAAAAEDAYGALRRAIGRMAGRVSEEFEGDASIPAGGAVAVRDPQGRVVLVLDDPVPQEALAALAALDLAALAAGRGGTQTVYLFWNGGAKVWQVVTDLRPSDFRLPPEPPR